MAHEPRPVFLRAGLHVTPGALAAGIVIHPRVVTDETKRPGRRQRDNGGGRVAGVARDVGADRRGMGLRDALGSMAGGAGAPIRMMGGMAAAAGSRRVYRCQGHGLPVAGRTAKLRVPLMPEADWAGSRGASRCGDSKLNPERLGKFGPLVTAAAISLGRILMMTDLATTGRFKRQHRP
jgi:hypothetical protein